eukprot:gene7358-11680_t
MEAPTYFGSQRIPLEVQRIIPILPILSTRSVQKVIALVVVYLTGDNLNNYDPKIVEGSIGTKPETLTKQINQLLESEIDSGIKKLTKKHEIEHATLAKNSGIFGVMFTGIYMILRSAVSIRMEPKKFKEQLTQLKMDPNIIKLLHEFYEQKFEKLIEISQDSSSWFNSIVGITWRIDVIISTGEMNRIFTPILQLKLELSNGDIKISIIVCIKRIRNN